jgi:hypothetical protein
LAHVKECIIKTPSILVCFLPLSPLYKRFYSVLSCPSLQQVRSTSLNICSVVGELKVGELGVICLVARRWLNGSTMCLACGYSQLVFGFDMPLHLWRTAADIGLANTDALI